MSKVNLQRVTSYLTGRTALCGVLVLAVPLVAVAQDQGGMLTQLRLSERFVGSDTTSPDAASAGVRTQFITDVDLAFSSETRTEMFTADFGAGYRFFDGPTTDGYTGEFTSPKLELSYKQTASSASFAVTASATQVELDDVSPLSLSSADNTLASDFADVTDGGTRTGLNFSSTLTLRDDAPFGLIFRVSASDISYQDLPTDSTLSEITTGQINTTARMDVSEVLQIRTGLRYVVTDTEGEARSERYGINASAVLTQPTGDWTLSGNHMDGDGGAQTQLDLGRGFELPNTKARASLGLKQATDGDIFVIGSATYEHDFGDESPFGPITAKASRDVALDGQVDEDVVTSLSVGGSYALTPLATMRMSADVAQSEDLASGDTIDLAGAGLSVDYVFDRNWRANAGLRSDWRDPSYEDETTSTTLSLGVTRTFDSRR